jgi:hypothetical protein
MSVPVKDNLPGAGTRSRRKAVIPLRLPTTTERIHPSIQDVRVNGTKDGKVNEVECDAIVEMI